MSKLFIAFALILLTVSCGDSIKSEESKNVEPTIKYEDLTDSDGIGIKHSKQEQDDNFRVYYKNEIYSGFVEEFYPDTNVVRKRLHVVDGRLDGKQFKYYIDGTKRSVAHFKAGKMHGKITDYRDDGKIRRESNYIDGERDGSHIQYNANGSYSEVSEYKNGEKVKETLYDDNGAVKSIRTYENGISIDCKGDCD